jgi:hypothetical protein
VSPPTPLLHLLHIAATLKVVNGYNDGSFRPSESVTGYAFAKMLLTAMGVTGTYTGNGWESTWQLPLRRLACLMALMAAPPSS